MLTGASFDYAVLRVVPRVERQEFLNVGVILFSREERILRARVIVDSDRLLTLWPDLDLETLRPHIEAVPRICEGDAGAGPIARLSQSERFHWLTSPRSTVLQSSPVHTGVCSEEDSIGDHLVDRLYKRMIS